VYRDVILSFLLPGKTEPTATGTPTATNTDVCAGYTGLPAILCRLGGFITGDPYGAYLKSQSESATATQATNNAQTAKNEAQKTEAERLVAKLNAGQSFTDAEWAWMRSNEPTLYGIAMSMQSIRTGLPNVTIPALTYQPLSNTERAAQNAAQLPEAQRLTAKLNAGQSFTDAEWAWMQTYEPTLYNIARSLKNSEAAPAPAADSTAPKNCNACNNHLAKVFSEGGYVPSQSDLADCCFTGWPASEGQITPGGEQCSNSFPVFQRWAQHHPGANIFCTRGMIGNM
jgi:uncharacterized protein YdbL (DUF1318 family)